MPTPQNLQPSLRSVLALKPTMLMPTTVGTQRAVPDAVVHRGILNFRGHAIVGDFVGTTTHVTGAIIGASDYRTTRGWVEAPVATLITGNDRRDRDLRAAMEVDRYPMIHFELTDATLVMSSVGSPDSTALVLNGALAIHGVTRRVELPAIVVRRGNTTRVTMHFPLDLSQYEVGLTKMFGPLRMHREIEARVNLQFVDRPTTDPNP